ncbi:MAG: cobalt-precorrin-6A reductase [Alphaproteobacteria bacterium]|nr:cobalt-precorrin-6A reductase [Alphaproteobacteria bacterium]
MHDKTSKILILGGTSEARALAERLSGLECFDITTSLKGLTKNPKPYMGRVREGGFGGINGLETYLRTNHIDTLIDATHPFARQMPFNAVEAVRRADISYLKLLRPAWDLSKNKVLCQTTIPSDLIKFLENTGKNIFLSVGSEELAAFASLDGCQIFARMINPPKDNQRPENCHVILERPPFDLQNEIALFEEYKIDILVTKNAGGKSTEAKIHACEHLGIPLCVIERPKYPSDISIYNHVDDIVNTLLKEK